MITLAIGFMGIVLKKTPGINSKFSNDKQKYKTQLQSLSLNFPFTYFMRLVNGMVFAISFSLTTLLKKLSHLLTCQIKSCYIAYEALYR